MGLALKLLCDFCQSWQNSFKNKNIVCTVADPHRSHWKLQSGFSCHMCKTLWEGGDWISSVLTLHTLHAYKTLVSGGTEEAIPWSVPNFPQNILGRWWKPTRVRSYCRTVLVTEKFPCRGRSPSRTRTQFYPLKQCGTGLLLHWNV